MPAVSVNGRQDLSYTKTSDDSGWNADYTFENVNATTVKIYSAPTDDYYFYLAWADVYYGVPDPTTYTVTWKNWDGTTLKTDTDVEEGATPTYDGAPPTKPADAQYTYTFSGWSDGTNTYAPDALPAVTGDTTYTAQFTAVPKPHTHDGITFQPWTSTNSLPTTAGNYYLANDVTLSGTWTVPSGTTNLCLNGHGIIRTGSGRVIDLSSSGRNLNIYDCDTVTEHRFTVNNPTENGAGVAVVNDALTENYQTFTGGYITGGNTNNGAGIHVYQATLKLYGGTVIGNSNTGDGGGIYVEKGGNLYIDGGTVSYNQARQGGGIYAPNISSFAKIHLNSGRIEKNYATYTGGGVYGGASVPVYLEGSIVVTGNYSLNAAGVTAAWNQSSARIYVSGSPYVYDNFNANGQSNLTGAYYENTMQITGNLGADCKVGLNGANGLLNYYKSDYTHTDIDPNTLFPYDNNNYILTKDGNNAKRISLYTITFKNYDDEVLKTSKVISGETPEYNGAPPTKPADAQYAYTFAGWKNGETTYAPNEALPAVTGDTTYTATFTAVPKPLITGHSLTLKGNIDVNFFIDPSAAGMKPGDTGTLTVNFEWANKGPLGDVQSQSATVTVDSSNYKKVGDTIKVPCKVCAAEMSSKIKATATLNGKTATENYCVRDYCEIILDANSDFSKQYKQDKGETKYNQLVDLVTKMLDYGAKAQTVFGINTGDPANSILNDYRMKDVTGDMFTAAILAANGRKADDIAAEAAKLGASFKTPSLVFLSENTLKLYFVKETDAFSTNGLTKWNQYWYAQKADIPAAELDTLQALTVSGKTLYYSALDYAKALAETTNADNAALAKALYRYNQAANVFFDDPDHSHTPGPAVRENEHAATCKAAGSYDEVVYCTGCGSELTRETKTIDKLAHTIAAVAEVPATTEADGVAAHYECSVCHTLFTDAQGNNETTAAKLVIPMLKTKTIILDNVTENTTVEDGYTITGTLTGNCKISISDGAKVTLEDVNITNLGTGCNWAGINCPGNAILVLKGENTVCAGLGGDGNNHYPGIWIAPDKTLTIEGDGSLTAYSGNAPYGAGIGGGYRIAAGNIVINGGIITATGGNLAAGIGSGPNDSCGDITINGGTVTATGTGQRAAGIGSGSQGNCGNITINGGTVTASGSKWGAGIGSGASSSCGKITISANVTSVTATKGRQAPNSIGAGAYNSTCGTVTIEDGANVIQN